MSKGFYHPERGYWETIGFPSKEVVDQYPEGTVETPLRPSLLHVWSEGLWVGPTQEQLNAAKAAQVRAERDNLLLTVDAIAGNALRWASLDASKQAEWAAYRQALLDIPQQAGFPDNITWPQEPSA